MSCYIQVEPIDVHFIFSYMTYRQRISCSVGLGRVTHVKKVRKLGVTEFVAEIRCPKDHPKSEKLGLVTEYGYSACFCRTFISKSLN